MKSPAHKSTADRFIRQAGSARNYYDTQTGEYVTRRKRDTLAAAANTAKGVTSRKPVSYERLIRQRHQQTRYQDLVAVYLDKAKAEGATVTVQTKTGLKTRPIGPGDVRKSSEFKYLIGELSAKNKNGSPSKTRMKAALIALGRRDDIPFFVTVGDSALYLKALERGGTYKGRQL